MITVPGFLLRRLYVKGSLKATPDGLEFNLKNGLGSGYAHKLWPLKVDGVEVPPESAVFVMDGEETAFAEVSKEKTFTLAMNRTIVIRAQVLGFSAGPHKLEMGFDVPGLGTLQFDFTDTAVDE
jgi:hypothetical protein